MALDTATLERFGRNLKLARLERGLSVRDVAEALGCSSNAVYKWEAGTQTPDDRYHAALEAALGVGVSDLFAERATARRVAGVVSEAMASGRSLAEVARSGNGQAMSDAEEATLAAADGVLRRAWGKLMQNGFDQLTREEQIAATELFLSALRRGS